ncbi:hypothetical protein HK405_000866, partial [Cladochytrium tenue]
PRLPNQPASVAAWLRLVPRRSVKRSVLMPVVPTSNAPPTAPTQEYGVPPAG